MFGVANSGAGRTRRSTSAFLPVITEGLKRKPEAGGDQVDHVGDVGDLHRDLLQAIAGVRA
jgi:hypothetical protein